jgi:hypothetical protein
MTDRPDPAPQDPLEDELRRLLHDRATVEPAALDGVRATYGRLPPRRRAPLAVLARAAAVLVGLGIGVVALAQLPAGPATPPTTPRLQEPSAFAGDPRRALCDSPLAIYAFELPRLADFRAYYQGEGFPTDDVPALIVVWDGRTAFDRMGREFVLPPGHYNACIVAGSPGDPAAWRRIDVSDADLTALLPGPGLIGDPARYADDPRFARCAGPQAEVLGAFEMQHARDYRLHVPAMGRSPELEVDDPAFVVIYRGRNPLSRPGVWPDPLSDPARRDVCVLVGADVAAATLNVYPGVDITGLVATLPDSSGSAPAPSTASSPAVTGTPGPATPEPAPAWTGDLAGQLDCDGPVRTIGGETGDVTEELIGPTPADLAEYLTRTNFDALPGRLELAEHEAHWVRYVHLHDDRLKTVVIATDTSPRSLGPWAIVGLRSCDPAEYDPEVGLAGVYHGVWHDAAGNPVPTELIHEITGAGHCGWDSATLMRYEGIQFIRDPEGVLADMQVAPYLADTDLPETAVDTGLRDGERHLWRSSDGRYVFVVTSDHVEGWPRAVRDFGCT